MSSCVECGSEFNIVRHHINYKLDFTVPVCKPCHKIIHKWETHPLYPDDPEKTPNVITVHDSVHHRATALMEEYDFTAIGEAVRHMCQEGGFNV